MQSSQGNINEYMKEGEKFDDCNVFVFKPYENIYVATATIFKDISVDEIDYYLGQVFQAMIQNNMVNSKDAELVSFILLTKSKNAHLSVVKRFDDKFTVNKNNILDTIKTVLANDDDPTQHVFRVKYGPDMPIYCYGKQPMITKDMKNRYIQLVPVLFSTFPKCEIDYAVTMKQNP